MSKYDNIMTDRNYTPLSPLRVLQQDSKANDEIRAQTSKYPFWLVAYASWYIKERHKAEQENASANNKLHQWCCSPVCILMLISILLHSIISVFIVPVIPEYLLIIREIISAFYLFVFFYVLAQNNRFLRLLEQVYRDNSLPPINDPTPFIENIGVEYSVIEEFIEKRCGGWNNEDLIGKTSHQVKENYLLKMTELKEDPKKLISYCKYIQDMQDIEGNARFRKADVFISHRWTDNFLDAIKAIKEYDMNHKKEDGSNLVYWFDFFCHNNEEIPDSDCRWVYTLQNLVKEIGTTLMIATPWNNPSTLDSTWCLFEVFSSLETKLKVGLAEAELGKFCKYMSDNPESGLFMKINSIDTKAKKPFEEECIKLSIATTSGFARVDRYVEKSISEAYTSLLQERVDKELVELEKLSRQHVTSSGYGDGSFTAGDGSRGGEEGDSLTPLSSSTLSMITNNTCLLLLALANLYKFQSYYEKASACYLRILEYKCEVSAELYFRASFGLGEAHLKNRQYEKAKHYYLNLEKASENHMENSKESTQYYRDLLKLAEIDLLMGNRTEAFAKLSILELQLASETALDYDRCNFDLIMAEYFVNGDLKINDIFEIEGYYRKAFDPLEQFLKRGTGIKDITHIDNLFSAPQIILALTIAQKRALFLSRLVDLESDPVLKKERLESASRQFCFCLTEMKNIYGDNHLDFIDTLFEYGLLLKKRFFFLVELHESAFLIYALIADTIPWAIYYLVDFDFYRYSKNCLISSVELYTSRLGENHELTFKARDAVNDSNIIKLIPFANILRRCEYALDVIFLISFLAHSLISSLSYHRYWACLFAAIFSLSIPLRIYNIKYRYAAFFDYSLDSDDRYNLYSFDGLDVLRFGRCFIICLSFVLAIGNTYLALDGSDSADFYFSIVLSVLLGYILCPLLQRWAKSYVDSCSYPVSNPLMYKVVVGSINFEYDEKNLMPSFLFNG